jgi:hypothetical protein
MNRYDAGTTNPTLLNRLCDEEGRRLLAERWVHDPEVGSAGD